MDIAQAPWLAAPLAALADVLAQPLDPSRRVYWLFLLSSALAAVIVVSWQRRAFDLRGILRSAFNPQFWLQKTHLVDVSLLCLNSALRLSLLVPLFGSHLLFTIWVARCWQAGFGDAPAMAWPWLAVALTYTAVFFLLEDLSRFSLHLAMHRIPLLWRLHRVHHGATALTPLTLYRVHPLEMALYYLRGLLVFGFVSGTFVYLFGRELSGLDILGVDALGFLFNLAAANLRHSHVWLSFGPLERWLVSPAQHQIHHSRDPAHRDRNYGTCLALWDRWLGSWLAAGAPRKLAFGVAGDAGHTPAAG